MQVNLYFEYASIVISVLLLIYFGTTKKASSVQNRIFLYLVLDNTLTAVFDIANKLIDYKGGQVDLLRLTTFMYFVTHLLVIPLIFFYVLSSIKNWYELSLKFKIFVISPILVAFAVLMLNPFMHTIYRYELDGTYVRESGYLMLYAVAGLYMILIAYLTVRYKEYLSFSKRVTIFTEIVILVVAMYLQSWDHNLRVETFGISYGLLLLFFLVQNPHDQVDNETGVYNRNAFMEIMSQDIAARRYFNLVEVIVTDYDDVANSAGYSRNNESVARKITDFLKELDNNCEGDIEIYRVESHQFCLKITGMAEENIIKIIRDIRNRFTKPWNYDGYDLIYKIKICHIALPEEVDSIGKLMGVVSGSVVKDINKEILSVSDFDLGKLERQMSLNGAIARALDEGKIDIVFSPICNVSDRKIVSAETGFRIFDSEIGYINQDEIVEFAEKNSRIATLSRMQVDRICKFVVDNDPKDIGLHSVFMTLTAAMCHQVGFIDYMVDKFDKSKVNPSSVIFSISEYTVHRAPELIATIMDDLHKKGYRFCLDDYGSGFTNIASIYEFNFDVIKISASVAKEALGNVKAKITFESSIELASLLGMKAIVGGVDDEELFTLTAGTSCHAAQGSYFLVDVDAKELINILVAQENVMAFTGMRDNLPESTEGGIA